LQATVSDGEAHVDVRLGSMTFEQLWREVSACHRFAVVLVKDEYWVIDMYRSRVNNDTLRPVIGPYEVFPNLDAAICAAILTYNRD
jgi:hypothetical protein